MLVSDAFDKADVYGKLARCLCTTEEHEFESRHVSSAKNNISEYPSRCIGLSDCSDNGEKLSIDNFLREDTIQEARSQDLIETITPVDLEIT